MSETKYHIIITRKVSNEEYQQQLNKYNEDTRYRNCNVGPEPQEMLTDKVLEVELTGEEFDRVKCSVIESM